MTVTLDTAKGQTLGWEGKTLRGMLEESEELFAQTGRYYGLEDLELQRTDPITYEKLFSRIRGGLVSAREIAMNISSSEIVRELGELAFALYTPEGDSISLSTGIIVHVHTMSDALKHMVRCDYEVNPGIRSGDIFANNVPQIGDVHNADVQTLIPIIWEGELLGWVGGVTHVVDVGAMTPGGAAIGPTTRFDDGLDLPCMKIGENDELYRWHLERCKLRVRTPESYILDERTRLAGCHMMRDTVERLVGEVGPDLYKGFIREVIEEGRRSFKSRLRQMTVPGRYRSPSFADVSFAEQDQLPKRAQRDFIMHTPFEIRIGVDASYMMDQEGGSAWGHHAFNCTPSAINGALWVQMTQTLICNDKVNDGGYLAIETVLPEGTVTNLGDHEGSTSNGWAMLEPNFHAFPRTLSRAFQARGFIEEIMAGYGNAGNIIQGGGKNLDGSLDAFMNFECACQGYGGKYVADGLDYAAAMFNSEGDMGDCEGWEQMGPILYLGRRIKASSAGPGRHRGGSGLESLWMIWNRGYYEVQNIGTAKMFTSTGLFGGYPGPTAHTHNLRDTDFLERARAGEAYATGDGSFDEPALFDYDGDREYRLSAYTLMQPIAVGDIYLSILKGGGGLGDPLDRPVVDVEEDIAEGFLLPRFAESTYAVSDRGAARKARLTRSVPTREWLAKHRERVIAGDFIEPVTTLYAECMKLSPRWAAEYRGFWDLDEDFEFDAETPTIDADSAAPGKVTPTESAAAYLETAKELRRSTPDYELPPADRNERPTLETLRELLDEKLPRHSVKDIQSAFKDFDRFDKWVTLLQERVPYDDKIVLPVGESLNVVRRSSDKELVIRCDCGHDFCGADENWKLDANVFTRDTEELMLEVYAKMSHADPEWMELREYYCPNCAKQLEVEAVPPGFPVVHEFLPDIEGFYEKWLQREMP
ncbi:MAG: hydantoinase B/oxoprolinase family protein [Actinobacteria bacterium]|nr:hydantoinase B/oxoprolinase family protein [Actinomycetota bacterium]